MAKEKVHKPSVVIPEDKQKAADFAVSALEKQYGKGTILRLGDRVGIKHPSIPTGIYQLDHYGIQIGGFPRGRVVEVYGPESSGKTTITLQVIAEAQKAGGLAAFIDVEHALDPTWASLLGVDVDKLYVTQPDNGEQALEVAEALVRSGAFDIVVIDSVAALVPQAELDGEMGDSHVGLQARLMSQALRKLTAVVSKSQTCVVFINQIREKVGVMFGSPETTAGGRALKFYASVRIDVRRIQTIKDGEVAIGNRVKFKLVKNKMGAPFREVEADLLFGLGFNTVGSVVDAGVLNGVIEKNGSWYSFKNERLGQGRDATCAELRENEALFKKVYDAVVKEDQKALEA